MDGALICNIFSIDCLLICTMIPISEILLNLIYCNKSLRKVGILYLWDKLDGDRVGSTGLIVIDKHGDKRREKYIALQNDGTCKVLLLLVCVSSESFVDRSTFTFCAPLPSERNCLLGTREAKISSYWRVEAVEYSEKTM